MKAQIGLEYLIIFGLSLVILTFLIYYSSQDVENTKWDINNAYAKSALSKVAEFADVAYVQGPPAQFYIYPSFPDNVRRAYIEYNVLTLELYWKDNILRNVTVESIANLTGNISNAAGTHKILVKAGNGFVNITEA